MLCETPGNWRPDFRASRGQVVPGEFVRVRAARRQARAPEPARGPWALAPAAVRELAASERVRVATSREVSGRAPCAALECPMQREPRAGQGLSGKFVARDLLDYQLRSNRPPRAVEIDIESSPSA
jgi:hypothetical protein